MDASNELLSDDSLIGAATPLCLRPPGATSCRLMHEQTTDEAWEGAPFPVQTWSGYLSLLYPERTFGLLTPDAVHDLVRRAAHPSLAQRTARQKFDTPAPTLVLPREPFKPTVHINPPKRTLLSEEPPFEQPPYRPGIIGKLFPKLGRITHAGLGQTSS